MSDGKDRLARARKNATGCDNSSGASKLTILSSATSRASARRFGSPTLAVSQHATAGRSVSRVFGVSDIVWSSRSTMLAWLRTARTARRTAALSDRSCRTNERFRASDRSSTARHPSFGRKGSFNTDVRASLASFDLPDKRIDSRRGEPVALEHDTFAQVSCVPQFWQNFEPGALTVWRFGQVFAVCRLCPQVGQNFAPGGTA